MPEVYLGGRSGVVDRATPGNGALVQSEMVTEVDANNSSVPVTEQRTKFLNRSKGNKPKS